MTSTSNTRLGFTTQLGPQDTEEEAWLSERSVNTAGAHTMGLEGWQSRATGTEPQAFALPPGR